MLLRNLIFSVSRSILRPSPYLPLTQLSNYHCVSRLLSPSLNVVNYGSSHSMLNQHGRANMSSDAPSASSSLDNELKSFLEEEIKAEKTNAIQAKGIPGFTVVKDGSCIRLKRAFKDEQITIKVDVNASTVDDDIPASEDQPPPLVSKPDFSVEIRKPNGKVFCITCHFLKDVNFDDGPEDPGQDKSKDDMFAIEAFTVVDDKNIDGDLDLDDNIYLGDASLVDGQLYDLLMDYLDERGIGKEFSTSLIEYCTAYEHEKYIELLEKLKSFVKS